MARRVIQFPVRNAFAAQRSANALARDEEQTSRENAHRIAEQVENEIARLAQRQSTGYRADYEELRNRGVVVFRQTSRIGYLSKRFTSAIGAFASKLVSRTAKNTSH